MLFGSLYISKSISNPIYALIGMMNTVKDRNFRKIPVKYPKSEIGILQTNYNNMVDEISSLLSRLVEEQKIKEKAELHALFEGLQETVPGGQRGSHRCAENYRKKNAVPGVRYF